MAKGKVHMAGAGTSDEGALVALCRQRHRKLLPLLFANEWGAVTCERCLTHRPAPAHGVVVTWLRRLMKRFRGGR